jgi:signal transduction histidine kinase
MTDHTLLQQALRLPDAPGALFDAVPEGVWIAGARGEILYLNPAAHALLDLDPSAGDQIPDGLYRSLRDRNGHELGPAEHPIARALAGESAGGVELQAETPGGGRTVYLSLSFAPLQARDGQVAGAIVFATDRTLQYQIERARDDFLASVAHDLRSPLTAIRGSAQLGLRWMRRDPVQREMLERTLQTIDAAAARLNRMLETLMDSARVESGSMLLQCAPTDLVALVREVVEHYRQESRRHTLVLEAPEEPLVGNWDGALLERAVENLVNNAVKYSPEGGRVEVSWATEGEMARVSVRDHGVGIPAEALPHIFNRFYRAKNAMGEIEGNGLGLFSVRGIIQRHGGRIDVWSEEGAGTEITALLPRRAPECDE